LKIIHIQPCGLEGGVFVIAPNRCASLGVIHIQPCGLGVRQTELHPFRFGINRYLEKDRIFVADLVMLFPDGSGIEKGIRCKS
jgi:hypothetical protein